MSGGLHGVGVSVVNALSSRLDLRIFRNGAEWFMRFHDGVPEAPLAELGPAPAWPEGSSREGVATGTEIMFLPSTATFTKTEFDFTTLEHRLRELAFLNSGLTIHLRDERNDKSADFFSKYGKITIVLARFVPVVRTVATVMAGASRMNVKIYTLYSAIGGVIWITTVTVAGYFLGQIGFIRDNLDLIVIAAVVVVICASAFPAVAHWVASRRAKQAAKGEGPGQPTIEPAAE